MLKLSMIDGRLYIPVLLPIVTPIVTIQLQPCLFTMYIAAGFTENCSRKDERIQRFHANPVGAKNFEYHNRNLRSWEYNVSTIKRYPTDSLARFDVHGESQNQEVSEGTIGISRLPKISSSFCILYKILVYMLRLYLTD